MTSIKNTGLHAAVLTVETETSRRTIRIEPGDIVETDLDLGEWIAATLEGETTLAFSPL